MLRWVYTVTAAASLLLCAFTAVLWIRSGSKYDCIEHGTSESYLFACTTDGRLILGGVSGNGIPIGWRTRTLPHGYMGVAPFASATDWATLVTRMLATMPQRMFTSAAALSLVLFIVAMLPLVGAPGGRLLLRDGSGSIARGSRTPSYALVYNQSEIAVQWTYSDAWSSGIGTPTWMFAALFAVLPDRGRT